MAQPIQSNFWSEERSRQEEQKRAVDLLLEDMQRYLPGATDPTTLSAVRDYMVTKYGHIENYDRLVLRHEAMMIHIRNAEKQLADLTAQAQALSAAPGDMRPDFTQENFRKALGRLTAVQARLVASDSKYMMLRTRNESLEQEVKQHKSILQRKEQDLERTKHILERVGAERDRWSRTADYVIHQTNDLERRLRKTEELYQELKRSQQGHTSAH